MNNEKTSTLPAAKNNGGQAPAKTSTNGITSSKKDVATSDNSPLGKLKSMMNADSVRQQFKNALQENADAFMASLIDLVGSDTNLQDCNPRDVCMEALKAATLKLPINKQLGFAYIVGFAKKATFVIGYKGLIQLALRTGQYRYLNADFIYEGETIAKDRMSGAMSLEGAPKSDKVIGYFAHMELKTGFTKTIASSREEIVSFAKLKCPSWKNSRSAWHTDFDAMALKTEIREMLSKWGVMTTEMQKAFADDEETDASRVRDDINQHANKGSVIDLTPTNENDGTDTPKGPAEEATGSTQPGTGTAKQYSCPNQDGQVVMATFCVGCNTRKGCPAHENEDNQAAPATGSKGPSY